MIVIDKRFFKLMLAGFSDSGKNPSVCHLLNNSVKRASLTIKIISKYSLLMVEVALRFKVDLLVRENYGDVFLY